jgi:hypothetical protein
MVEWTPFQTHCYRENLVELRIEAGTSGLVAMVIKTEPTPFVVHARLMIKLNISLNFH